MPTHKDLPFTQPVITPGRSRSRGPRWSFGDYIQNYGALVILIGCTIDSGFFFGFVNSIVFWAVAEIVREEWAKGLAIGRRGRLR